MAFDGDEGVPFDGDEVVQHREEYRIELILTQNPHIHHQIPHIRRYNIPHSYFDGDEMNTFIPHLHGSVFDSTERRRAIIDFLASPIGSLPPPPLPPLTNEEIDALILSKSTEICPITMEPLSSHIGITICKHLFNKEAILEWMRTHSTCPVCRKKQNQSNLVFRELIAK